MTASESSKTITNSLGEEISPYVDLTNLIPENIKIDEGLRNFLADIAESGYVFETEDNKFIGIDRNNNKIRHLIKGKKTTDSNRRLRENRAKYLNAIEKIINIAVESKVPDENSKKETKPDVQKYHYFRSFVKISDKYYELRLDTEEKTDKKNSEMPAPVLYIRKNGRTHGKLNSPQNTSLGHDFDSIQGQKSIPLYLYDIFETMLSMPNPEKYLKDKMYRVVSPSVFGRASGKREQKNSEMPAPIIYISKRRTAGKLNSPQNTSLGHYPTTEVENKSMPLYLYDIFETKLIMPNPEMYLKDTMYRDAVNNGNIEKAKTILLQEAKLKGYEITIENRNAITQIRYDEKGYLIPLSKSFDNDTANLDLPVFSCITCRFRKGF